MPDLPGLDSALHSVRYGHWARKVELCWRGSERWLFSQQAPSRLSLGCSTPADRPAAAPGSAARSPASVNVALQRSRLAHTSATAAGAKSAPALRQPGHAGTTAALPGGSFQGDQAHQLSSRSGAEAAQPLTAAQTHPQAALSKGQQGQCNPACEQVAEEDPMQSDPDLPSSTAVRPDPQLSTLGVAPAPPAGTQLVRMRPPLQLVLVGSRSL